MVSIACDIRRKDRANVAPVITRVADCLERLLGMGSSKSSALDLYFDILLTASRWSK